MERILTKIEIKKILEERNSVQKVQFKKKMITVLIIFINRFSDNEPQSMKNKLRIFFRIS